MHCRILNKTVKLLVLFLSCCTWTSTSAEDNLVFEITDRSPNLMPAPKVQAWETVSLDPDYGGMWVVSGDVDGDGEVEIVSVRNKYWWTGPIEEGGINTHYVSSFVVQELDGDVLWSWGNPDEGRRVLSHDVACQVYDWNGDGKDEIIATGQDRLRIFRGSDGELLQSFPIPEFASDCIITANLTGGDRPRDFVIKDRYFQMWGLSGKGELLWASRRYSGLNDTWHLGHRPRPVDVDNDGRDEIFAGFFLTDDNGDVLWEIDGCKHEDVIFVHPDSTPVLRRGDRPEDWRLAFTWCSGLGIALVDGNGNIQKQVPGAHYESIRVGNIFPDHPAPQMVTDVDHLPYGQSRMEIFDADLNRIAKIHLDYGRLHNLVDWDGDGFDDIVVAEHGAVYNYRGEKIATLDLGGETGRFLQIGDYSGDQVPDILIVDAKMKGAHIFRNEKAVARKTQGMGTGPNFTLY